MTAATPITVEIKGLRRHFGAVKAVDDIDFTLQGGEVHGFIGPNGAGKTTTMRIMATLDMPDAGDVLLDGVSILNYPDRLRPDIGFMPDYLDSFSDMLVEDYLDFYARAYRLDRATRLRRLAAVVDFTGLGELLERPTTGLSKGQKQRLSLARMLTSDPKLLILDEPSAGLDPRARIELRNLIRSIADRGKAVFISSHILTELAESCDAVTIIEHGKIRASDRIHNVRKAADGGGTRVLVILDMPTDAERERLRLRLAELPGVQAVADEQRGATFNYEGEPEIRTRVLRELVASDFRISDFHAASSDLEDAFMRLTVGRNEP